MKNETFEMFQERVHPEIVEVRKLLRELIPREPEEIFDMMRTAEGFCDRTKEILAEAEEQLDLEEKRATIAVMNEHASYSADLKKMVVAADVSLARSYRDKIEAKVQGLDGRLKTCQSLLAYCRDRRTGTI